MLRKYPLVTGDTYHVMSKSIAGYEIFNRPEDYERMMRLFRFFNLANPPCKFSQFLKRDPDVQQKGFEYCVQKLQAEQEEPNAAIIAFALMPTHFHILAQQKKENGLSNLIGNALNGYSRYFNTKYNRHGVLWMGRFKNVIIEDDEQMLHTMRYIHLNPTTANLVKQPEDWRYSSYLEYIHPVKVMYPITHQANFFNMTPKQHQAFTEDQQDAQQSLAIIKHQIIE